MLRNDLINLLAERDNDAVTVDVGGILIDIDAVSYDRGNIVLVLDPEELQGTLEQTAGESRGIPTARPARPGRTNSRWDV